MAFIALVFVALTAVSLAAAPPPLPVNPGKGLTEKASAPNQGDGAVEKPPVKSPHVHQTSTDADSREGRQYYGGGDGLRPYGYGGYGGYRGYGGDSGPSGYGGYGGWHGYSGYGGGYRGSYGVNGEYRRAYGGLER